MSVLVRIPTPLQKITGGVGEVNVDGSSVKELLDGLEKVHPGLKERLVADDGQLRRFVNLYVNEEDVRFLKGMDTELSDGDEVSIVPAIAGGTDQLK
jgi:molybdopterin synthase sulfur carrier subunit